MIMIKRRSCLHGIVATAALGALTAFADTYVFDSALSGQDNVDWTRTQERIPVLTAWATNAAR